MTRFSIGYRQAIVGFAILLGTRVSGMATGITDATYNLTVNTPHTVSHTPGTISVPDATATVGAVPSPSIALTATEDTNHGSFAGADLTYYVEYLGPDATIPVDLAFSMAYSGNFLNDGLTYAKIAATFGNDGGSFCIGNDSCLNQAQYTGVIAGWMTTNTIYSIHLEALAEAGQNSAGATMSASVDPVLSIDSSFTGDASSYSLILSNGVGNESATAPEPATLWLLAVAGGAMGLLVVRTRRS